MAYKRQILLGLSDLHSGFQLGLTNPDTELMDKNGIIFHPQMSDSQMYLWDTYLWGIEETRHLAGRDDIYVFELGDPTHGNKYISEQISTRISDQIDVAVWNFYPLLDLKNVKILRMAIGTSAHEFGEGSASLMIAGRLRERYVKKDIRALYHGVANFNGFQVDYFHHGPSTGTRNWLYGNVARLYLQSKMMGDLDAGDVPASLVLSGHFHTYVKVYHNIVREGKEYESWLVVLPSLCLLGDYGTQITRSLYRLSPGVVAFEIIDNRLFRVYPFLKPLDIRTHEDFDETNKKDKSA